ncbi:hypothetical protein GCM10008014_36840 [Paenibacillus silvae]|uniref:Hint domain-containing protein n=2 Tax=Paenibacillus silvae TaxID=1325358 RepID=A0ABQ1ZE96_9BACL|nr:hypothetical protein GCM10008014_36840 [Paenibacillus silvae]
MTDAAGITQYAYTPVGELEKMTYPDGAVLTLGYDARGARTRQTFQHGSYTLNLNMTYKGAAALPASLSLTSGSGTALGSFTYTYRGNNSLAQKSTGSGWKEVYTYEGLNLKGLAHTFNGTNGPSYSYAYDNNRNITSKTDQGVASQFTYDKLNRIQTSSPYQETYAYDVRDNRSSLESEREWSPPAPASYTYDARNQLTGATVNDQRVSYRYNGDGLMTERSTGGQTTRYYYDDRGLLVAEGTVSSTGDVQITAGYIYDAAGKLTARQIAGENQLQSYVTNGHGDVTEIRDASGNVLNRYTYDIWGNPETTEETVPNALRYAGEYWDEVTGLQYLRARWYDPSVGRFINEDSYEGQLTNPLSLNLYTYVRNNPLIYIDPSGHREEWGAGGGAGKDFGYWQKQWNLFKDSHSTWSGIIDFWTMGTVSALNEYYRVSMENPWSVEQFFQAGYLVMELNPAGKVSAKLSTKGGKFIDKAISKACNCFTAGTKVLTDEGEKPIEEIEVGDKVLAKSDETGEVAYKEVVGLFQKQADEIYYVHIGDEIIEVTGEHPFWLDGKGWTFVKDLKVGDLLVSSDGTKLAIDKIEKEPREATVYNFEVDDFHSYFVSNLGIWVHNCDLTKWNKGSFHKVEDSAEYHFKKHGASVGAETLEQYIRKAEEFARTAKKGSTKSTVSGAVEGTIRYKKNGKYVDIAPDGTIVSFGKT